MMTTDEFLLVKRAAELLGVSANTVRAWALSGKLQEYRHPVNNYRLSKRDDVQTLLEQIATPSRVDMLTHGCGKKGIQKPPDLY